MTIFFKFLLLTLVGIKKSVYLQSNFENRINALIEWQIISRQSKELELITLSV